VNLDSPGHLLKLIDREVWIVSARAGEHRGGLTATWVAPAAFDPQRPALLVNLSTNHFTAELVAESGQFAAHLLREDQHELAWNFARDSGRSRDKLAGLETNSHGDQAGPPLLNDCLAWFECRVFARQTAGDRTLYWADVVRAAQLSNGPPLREQPFFRRLSAGQRQTLADQRAADMAQGLPAYENWRQSFAPPPAAGRGFPPPVG
jgi:flavin reductase (DIM6/NTAB) family NADH-FMN oxidoreductase RutF